MLTPVKDAGCDSDQLSERTWPDHFYLHGLILRKRIYLRKKILFLQEKGDSNNLL